MYAPQYQQPMMQGYAPQPPQMAYPQYSAPSMRRPGSGWWRWALAAGLGGLGVGSVLLGNKMDQNDKEQIAKNKRQKWMPNFDLDTITMVSLGEQATKFLPKILGLKNTIASTISNKKALADAKNTQKLNTDFATAFKAAQDNNDITALNDAINNVVQSGNDNLINKKLWKKAAKTSQQGYFSESTNYYDRYKDINFNMMMPMSGYSPMGYAPRPYAQPYPQPMTQGYAPQASYYAPRPAVGRNLGRLAMGLSALAALGGGAYALKKASAHNQELADSQKPSFINKINIPDLLLPVMGATNLVGSNLKIANARGKDKLKAIGKDTKADIENILNGTAVNAGKDRKENNVKSGYKPENIASQIADVTGIALPFVKKFFKHRAEEDD